MVEIYSIELKERIDSDRYNKYTSFLDNNKRERIKKFKNWEDSQRSLLSEIFVRYYLCNKLKIKNNDLYFEFNKYGKPFLKGFKNIHFNISHSGNWIIIVFNNNYIGVDVEKIEKIDYEIADRFFTPDEYNFLNSVPKNRGDEIFFELWTMKESYIKAKGLGLSLPLNSFSVIKNNKIVEKIVDEEKNIFFYKKYKIDNSYKLSVCSLGNEFEDNIIPVDLNFINIDNYL
jgi:4'-phosphopantetheinyl transferase